MPAVLLVVIQVSSPHRTADESWVTKCRVSPSRPKWAVARKWSCATFRKDVKNRVRSSGLLPVQQIRNRAQKTPPKSESLPQSISAVITPRCPEESAAWWSAATAFLYSVMTLHYRSVVVEIWRWHCDNPETLSPSGMWHCSYVRKWCYVVRVRSKCSMAALLGLNLKAALNRVSSCLGLFKHSVLHFNLESFGKGHSYNQTQTVFPLTKKYMNLSPVLTLSIHATIKEWRPRC